ncbi:hypothetical protein AV530_013755 [Patagioenas fasciata monilis]|uniref:Reelin domain-containing protein n=1 Tax=Patagioenas fasciata monilis TaxID=372326 RepID=A0A1V4J858_PATFA|nr:hypothetical protein AV530_013755 [Patagioenas fasciata monilis]
MAAFLSLVQLLFIGTLIVPAYTATEVCDWLLNAAESNFTISTSPTAYQANTTYLVTITDNRNASDSTNVTNYLLQAVSPQNASTGEWEVADKENCSGIDTAILNVTQQAANWTSSVSNISSVEIRAYIVFADRSAVFKTVTLSKATETTTLPSSTTPNSVSVVQSSSFFIAVIQLPLLLVTSKLLS